MPEPLPKGYSLTKDAVLDVWYVLVEGRFLIQYDDKPWTFTSEARAITFCHWYDTIKDLVINALENDEAHHKQWYLWRLADMFNLDATEIYAEEGIAP